MDFSSKLDDRSEASHTRCFGLKGISCKCCDNYTYLKSFGWFNLPSYCYTFSILTEPSLPASQPINRSPITSATALIPTQFRRPSRTHKTELNPIPDRIVRNCPSTLRLLYIARLEYLVYCASAGRLRGTMMTIIMMMMSLRCDRNEAEPPKHTPKSGVGVLLPSATKICTHTHQNGRHTASLTLSRGGCALSC